MRFNPLTTAMGTARPETEISRGTYYPSSLTIKEAWNIIPTACFLFSWVAPISKLFASRIRVFSRSICRSDEVPLPLNGTSPSAIVSYRSTTAYFSFIACTLSLNLETKSENDLLSKGYPKLNPPCRVERAHSYVPDITGNFLVN